MAFPTFSVRYGYPRSRVGAWRRGGIALRHGLAQVRGQAGREGNPKMAEKLDV